MKKIFISQSEDETFSYGKELSSEFVPGDVIALVGNLGSGKTVLTKGIASGIGVNEVVNSPTFKLIGEYKSDPPLFHFDFYRIKSPKEIIDFGIEYYYSAKGICVIEWADLFPNLIPNNSKWFYFQIDTSDKRKIIYRKEFIN
tara:strand:+ start:48 stop:476 length:429 start_codon:yes stop_codon:yes gene_type:complete